ncbi:hypothetical protein Tco_0830732 [Tanacetum coccineum]
MPSLPIPDPAVSCLDDLEIFKYFENEFPAIFYNDDALTSKSNFSTEPTLCPQHIDKFYLKDETSLSKDDEVEQSVLYFNDLFPFNIVYPDDLKSDKGNDDNEIDIIQSSRDNENTNNLLKERPHKIKNFIMGSFIMGLNVNIVAWNHFVNGMLYQSIRIWKIGLQEWIRRIRVKPIRHMAPLPPRDQRHLWLHYQVVGYTEEIVHDFEQRLKMIFGRQVNRVHILDFEGLTLDMRHDLAERMRMVYTRDDRQEFILALGLHTAEEMAEDIFGAYWLGRTLLEMLPSIYLHPNLCSKAVPQIILISSENIKEVMAEVKTKETMEELATNDRANYYSGITSITNNGKRDYKLKGKFLDDLHKNAFSGTNGVGVDMELFTYDIERTMDYEDYENRLNDEPEEPWSENGVPYEIGDHICEPFRFKNRKTKWPTYNSNEDGFCNGGELPGMVRVGYMTYFQDHEWYNNLMDGSLKDEALEQKSIYQESWGDAKQSVINFLKLP